MAVEAKLMNANLSNADFNQHNKSMGIWFTVLVVAMMSLAGLVPLAPQASADSPRVELVGPVDMETVRVGDLDGDGFDDMVARGNSSLQFKSSLTGTNKPRNRTTCGFILRENSSVRHRIRPKLCGQWALSQTHDGSHRSFKEWK